jgi:hypothetical protein
MKKRHFVLITILILIGLFIAFSAAAHPYDAPLTFIEHKTDDGGVKLLQRITQMEVIDKFIPGSL